MHQTIEPRERRFVAIVVSFALGKILFCHEAIRADLPLARNGTL
jgi:hypothetical protein